MANLYIFGDSFSVDYNFRMKQLNINDDNFCIKYYKKEIENGYIGEYKDLQYYLKRKLNLYKIINTAQGGCSNSTIFENFTIHSPRFKPGDYVSFQSSIFSRFRVSGEDELININNVENAKMFNFKNFNFYEIKKLAIEHCENFYLEEAINFIRMVRHVCKLSKVNFHIWTIDTKLSSISTLYNGVNYLKISDKFRELTDGHPSFEGNESIADIIINNWEHCENFEKHII